MKGDVLHIYTDGSCWNSDGIGGWAYIFVRDGNQIDYGIGNTKDTTSQRMEIQPVIEALQYAKQQYGDTKEIEIYSDSAYVVNAINHKWYEEWILKDWIEISNAQLWKDLLQVIKSINSKVTFIKVKGHSGNEYNEMADRMAGDARKQLIDSKAHE